MQSFELSECTLNNFLVWMTTTQRCESIYNSHNSDTWLLSGAAFEVRLEWKFLARMKWIK